MKELSNIELHFLEKELQSLVGAKVDKIFQPAKKELLLQLHKAGKVMVRILPNLLWITTTKHAMPETLPGFCMLLRKRLNQARIKTIQQLKPERVLAFVFEKEDTYRLVIELFGTGNMILCDKEGKIIAATESQTWKDRTIRPGEHYKLPQSAHNIFTISQDDFTAVLTASSANISKTLATTLNLGGLYAEELCIRAGIQPTKLHPAPEECIQLYQALQELLHQQLEPVVVLKDAQPLAIVPIKLAKYKLLQHTSYETLSAALDAVITPQLGRSEKAQAESAYQAKLDKINTMIAAQQKNLKKLEEAVKTNQKKGEYAYEQYQTLTEMLTKIIELRKTLSWKEVKKQIPQIKEVDEAQHTVILEV